jgi:glutamate synthase (NADPH) large chain
MLGVIILTRNGYPQAQGLYSSDLEKDSCGVGFAANVNGIKSNSILKQGLQILKNLKHRGAVGADPDSGDGSGIMLQIPHEFFVKETAGLGIQLPDAGDYAVGMLFLPRDPNVRLFCEGTFEKVLRDEGQQLLGWRQVPVNEKACGESARATRPVIVQVFIDRNGQTVDEFRQKLLIVRKQAQNLILDSGKPTAGSFYAASLSDRTIVYKGLVLGYRLDEFYLDLQDDSMSVAIALVHERYSTNTFPSWQLAQPFRYIAHNGEINTIVGNINKMNAREGVMFSKSFGENFRKALPIIEPFGSDSASLDNALELFFENGFSLENSMMILVPEAWQKDKLMDECKRSFYEYHARLMEPWDGPSTIAFTDGTKIGVSLDRNGLRPARYVITKDNLVIMASETGVVDIDDSLVAKKGIVEPGKLFVIDTARGEIVPDEEIKHEICGLHPFSDWIKRNRLTLKDIDQHCEVKTMRKETLLLKQRIFGYQQKELRNVIGYMVNSKSEPMGSMGMDIPLAALSDKPELLFNYFKQTFAQVTNPPIDPIREASVMSLSQYIGSHGKFIDQIETYTDRKYLELRQPVLTNSEIEDIKHLDDEHFSSVTIPIIFETDRDQGLKEALDSLCKRAEQSVLTGHNIIILSDKNINMYFAPIPSLLALSAVNAHLTNRKLRTFVDIIVETGDARDVMHIALLLGYGAKAVNPYMVYYSIAHMIETGQYLKNIRTAEEGFENYRKAVSSGLLKIISRMGISTLQSYSGAQTFQILGLSDELVSEYFPNTPTRISGIGLDQIAHDVLSRQTIYAQDKTSGKVFLNIRDLLDFKKMKNAPVNLAEVEPAESILKRFTISGMSFGSLSKEAHETIAVAMNRIGATSNSGEGGEDPARYSIDGNGDSRNSAVKQVASARFGVTANYLVNCRELQIKMAQGAKPGEGGHLPGGKVTAEIAKVRHSVPGIDLISPPPHHDIYSIEDLAQLIFDLKNVNPAARIGVKLVSEVGIGTVAAGVAKGHADVIMISGHDGGTGASPVSSMKYVGLPWELGLAEVQQTLLLNDLRSRVTLQVDGKIKTGRDIVVAALLGAEEYGLATGALVSLGCIMCRQCGLNRCPVGIATQDAELRKKFSGKPEDLIAFLTAIADEARELMAELGFRSLDEMIGKPEFLDTKSDITAKLKGLDLSQLLYKPELPSRIIGKHSLQQDHKISDVMDVRLIDASGKAFKDGTKVTITGNIRNTDRAVGAMLSGEIAKRFGDAGLEDDTITVKLKGSAGQSFGAFGARGLTLMLNGDANDYVGKGLSGAKIILTPPEASSFTPSENIIAGNTILYGATSGKAFIQGKVGQRFCVRNSGAVAVVEGVGNHGCEYMTGGTVVILGPTGSNFGAGMSGGVAYVLDEKGDFASRCNKGIAHQLRHLDDSSAKDLARLKALISEYCEATRSAKAALILKDWNSFKGKFVKVSSPVYEKHLV